MAFSSFLLLLLSLFSLCPLTSSFQFYHTNATVPDTNPLIHLVAVGPTILNQPETWCVVESLFRSSHPDTHPLDLFIWHDEPLSLDPSSVSLLSRIHHLRGNIHFVLLNFQTIFQSTPLEQLYTQEGLQDMGNETMWGKYGRLWKQNLCNAARMAILFKFGGTYIDIDHIVFRDVRLLPAPGLAFQSASRPNNAAMAFPLQHPFLDKMMTKFVKTYDGNAWGHNGPDLLRGMVRSCHDQKVCSLRFWKGVYNYKTFNSAMFLPERKQTKPGMPDERERRKKFLDFVLEDVKEEIVFHTWHHVTRILDAAEIAKFQRGAGKGVVGGYGETPLGYLRLKNCPCSTFELLEREVEEVGEVVGGGVDVGVCRRNEPVDVRGLEHREEFLYGVLMVRGDITKEERERRRGEREKWREDIFKRKMNL